MPDHLVMKLTGKVQGEIKGECKKEGHEGQIDIHSVDFGITVPADMNRGGGGAIGGKAQAQLVSITKRGDAASVRMFNAITANETMTEVIIYYQFQGGETAEYQTHKLKDALLTSWHQSGHESGEPVESVTFTYAEIEVVYHEQSTDDGSLGGGITGMYRVKEGVASS